MNEVQPFDGDLYHMIKKNNFELNTMDNLIWTAMTYSKRSEYISADLKQQSTTVKLVKCLSYAHIWVENIN